MTQYNRAGFFIYSCIDYVAVMSVLGPYNSTKEMPIFSPICFIFCPAGVLLGFIILGNHKRRCCFWLPFQEIHRVEVGAPVHGGRPRVGEGGREWVRVGADGCSWAAGTGARQQSMIALGCAILKDWYESLKGRDGHQHPGPGGCALWDWPMLRRSPTITGARY